MLSTGTLLLALLGVDRNKLIINYKPDNKQIKIVKTQHHQNQYSRKTFTFSMPHTRNTCNKSVTISSNKPPNNSS